MLFVRTQKKRKKLLCRHISRKSFSQIKLCCTETLVPVIFFHFNATNIPLTFSNAEKEEEIVCKYIKNILPTN